MKGSAEIVSFILEADRSKMKDTISAFYFTIQNGRQKQNTRFSVPY